MKPAPKSTMECLINIERAKYNITSTPTLQWLLRLTKLQMNTVSNRALYHQARIVHEAVRREIVFRNEVLALEIGIITTPDFWDCECEEDFIHSSADEACPTCGARRDEQPDSRVNEVSEMLGGRQ